MLTLHHQLTPIRHHLPQHTRRRQQPTLTKLLQPQLIRLQRLHQRPLTRHQLLFQLTHHQQHTHHILQLQRPIPIQTITTNTQHPIRHHLLIVTNITSLQPHKFTIAVHLIRAIQQVRPRVKGDQ
jgi:hypothetical protein